LFEKQFFLIIKMVATLYIAPVMLFLLVSIAVICIAVFVGRSDSTGFTGLSGYTVGPTGNYKTIQAAVDAAAATGTKQTIYVQGGTYTEDVKISTSGISLIGLGANINLTGNLFLTSPNLVTDVADIQIENMNITGNITSTTPNAFYNTGTHVGNIDVSGGGATSKLSLENVSSSGGTVTGSGAGGLFLVRSTVFSPITMTDQASLNGSDAVFRGDLVLGQTVGGINNMTGGGVVGAVTVNGPASFAVTNANTTSPTWISSGTGASLLMIGNTGNTTGQSFTSLGGGLIQIFNHFGTIALFVMNDSLGTIILDHVTLGLTTFDIADSTTGKIFITDSSFNHFDDQTFALPTMNGGLFMINNCAIYSDRMRFGGTVNYNAKNTTFTLNEANPFTALMRLDSATSVVDFHTCVFDVKRPTGAVVWNFGVAGTSVTAVNCSIRTNTAVPIANGGFGTINRPEIAGAGQLEIQGGAAGGPLDPGTVFGIVDVFTV
jgi:hypothetical protein